MRDRFKQLPILLLGGEQSGKTTLFNLLTENSEPVNWESLGHLVNAVENPSYSFASLVPEIRRLIVFFIVSSSRLKSNNILEGRMDGDILCGHFSNTNMILIRDLQKLSHHALENFDIYSISLLFFMVDTSTYFDANEETGGFNKTDVLWQFVSTRVNFKSVPFLVLLNKFDLLKDLYFNSSDRESQVRRKNSLIPETCQSLEDVTRIFSAKFGMALGSQTYIHFTVATDVVTLRYVLSSIGDLTMLCD